MRLCRPWKESRTQRLWPQHRARGGELDSIPHEFCMEPGQHQSLSGSVLPGDIRRGSALCSWCLFLFVLMQRCIKASRCTVCVFCCLSGLYGPQDVCNSTAERPVPGTALGPSSSTRHRLVRKLVCGLCPTLRRGKQSTFVSKGQEISTEVQDGKAEICNRISGWLFLWHRLFRSSPGYSTLAGRWLHDCHDYEDNRSEAPPLGII